MFFSILSLSHTSSRDRVPVAFSLPRPFHPSALLSTPPCSPPRICSPTTTATDICRPKKKYKSISFFIFLDRILCFFIYYIYQFILYIYTYSGSTVSTAIRRGHRTPRGSYGRTVSCCCVFGEVFLSPKKGKKRREGYMGNIYIYARYVHTLIPRPGRRRMVLSRLFFVLFFASPVSFPPHSWSFLSLSRALPFCYICFYSFFPPSPFLGCSDVLMQ